MLSTSTNLICPACSTNVGLSDKIHYSRKVSHRIKEHKIEFKIFTDIVSFFHNGNTSPVMSYVFLIVKRELLLQRSFSQQTWHKSCFHCKTCNMQLNSLNVKMRDDENRTLYCIR